MAESKKQPKVIGGINWSTRAKSKTFWVAIVSAIAVFANQVTSAFGVDYSIQIEQGVNIVGSILTFLAMIGVVVDNNTKGIKDSEIVRTDYKKPRNDKDPNEFIQWQSDVDYTRETFEDSNAEEVTESVDGLRDVDQEEIEEEPEYLEVTEDPSVDNPDSAPLGSNSVETLELDKEAPKSLGDQTPKSKGGEVE